MLGRKPLGNAVRLVADAKEIETIRAESGRSWKTALNQPGIIPFLLWQVLPGHHKMAKFSVRTAK